MKIRAIILSTLCAMGILSCTAYAGICGEVLSTDITAYIDEQPIESFNINDYTYVIAEDLRGYGFNVDWSEAERTLTIYRNRSAQRALMPMDKVNIKKSDVPFRAHVFDVYETDIVTYFGGNIANAYNVNGQTLIMIDELSRFGFFDYNDTTRSVRIDMAGFDEANLVPEFDRTEISIPCSKIEGSIKFTGYTADNKPDGYGVMSEHYEFTNGLESTEDYYTSGDFSGGKMNGYMYFRGKKTPHNGSDRRVRDYYTFAHYTNGEIGGRYEGTDNTAAQSGYYLSIEKCDGQTAYRTERNGSFKREITIDSEYRYGYRIDSEGYVDSYGQIVDYTKTDAGKIVSVSSGSNSSYIIDDKGDLYVFGEFGKGDDYTRKDVPVKVDTGIAKVNANNFISEPSVIDANGNMYYLFDKLYKYNNTDVPVVFKDVKKTDNYFFLTNDGKLYRKPVDFSWTMYDAPVLVAENVIDFSASALNIMYQTSDGAVYKARLNYAEDSGSGYIDDYDLSKPVKLYDSARYISAEGRYLAVDNDNVLWGWSSPYYGTGYKDPNDIFTTHEPIRLAEDVTSAQASGGTFIAYTKTDGNLYVMGDITEPGNESIFGIKDEEKILDDVKEFSICWGYILAVKNDGTLWVWGRNNAGRLGIGAAKEARTAIQITEFYSFN